MAYIIVAFENATNQIVNGGYTMATQTEKITALYERIKRFCHTCTR